MSGEIENDVEGSSAIRHRRRNEPARSSKERGIPPMIDERRERDAHLADDLRPKLQRVTGLAPRASGRSGIVASFLIRNARARLKDAAYRRAEGGSSQLRRG
jgi:hypothetical protein